MRTPSLALRPARLAALSAVVAASALGLAPSALAAAPVPAAAPAPAQYDTSVRCTAGIGSQLLLQGTTVSIRVVCQNGATVTGVVVRSTPVSLPLVAQDASGVSRYSYDTNQLEVGDHTFTVSYSDGTSQVMPFTVYRPQASIVPAHASGSGLAFTGANAVVPLAVVGGVLVLGGAGAYAAARRRRDETA